MATTGEHVQTSALRSWDVTIPIVHMSPAVRTFAQKYVKHLDHHILHSSKDSRNEKENKQESQFQYDDDPDRTLGLWGLIPDLVIVFTGSLRIVLESTETKSPRPGRSTRSRSWL